MIRIALTGNPNSGKTTLFNVLTGSNQFVGNWPGVTVEKKSGKYKNNKEIEIIDLPGIYSLSPYTLEEVVARNYLMNEKPDAILNIIDGTNIERNLYLTTQLMELDTPMVLAINMVDILEKTGNKIDIDYLGESFGCEVVEVSALKEKGIQEAIDKVLKAIEGKRKPKQILYSQKVESAIQNIEKLIEGSIKNNNLRWMAIKFFERDDKVVHEVLLTEEKKSLINEFIQSCEEELEDDSESIIINDRYLAITQLMKKVYLKKMEYKVSTTEKIDRVVTNRWLALPIFALIMFIVYYVSITTIGGMMTDWTNDVLFGEIVPTVTESFLVAIKVAPWLQGLILDGIVGGVGAVLGFVPQMFVLFAFLAFLEACGYMARVSFIMDRVFRKFGLSGKSFIPMLIGTGCSVPAVMASRTIESQRDRRLTIMTTPFVPCSAKLPIIALIAGALFRDSWWVAPSAYFIGITAIIISGVMLKKMQKFSGEVAPFVMELPPYHLPTLKNIWRSVWERGWSFIKKAGTIILLSAIAVWFLTQFGVVDGRLQMVENLEDGFLATMGSWIAPVFAPLGFGHWQAAVATLTGFVAKENVVGTLGVLYGSGEIAENGVEIWGMIAKSFTSLSAYAFLVFNLLCAPCFAAMGAIHREMNSTSWTLITLGYQTGFAYAVSLMIYQFGNWSINGVFGLWTVVALVILSAFLFFLFRHQPKERISK